MQPVPAPNPSWLNTHILSEEDSIAVAALRAVVAPLKGKFEGTSGRGPFDSIMERGVAEGVTFEAATMGGMPGWWAKPAQAQAQEPRSFTYMVAASTAERPRRSG